MEKHVIDGEATESDSENEREVIATVCKPLQVETLTEAEPTSSSYVVSGEAEESDEEKKEIKKLNKKVPHVNSGNRQSPKPKQSQRDLLRHQCLLQMRLWECNVMLHHSTRAITDTTAAHNRKRLHDVATMLLETQENVRGAANNLRAANAKLRSAHFELKLGLATNVLANVRIQ